MSHPRHPLPPPAIPSHPQSSPAIPSAAGSDEPFWTLKPVMMRPPGQRIKPDLIVSRSLTRVKSLGKKRAQGGGDWEHRYLWSDCNTEHGAPSAKRSSPKLGLMARCMSSCACANLRCAALSLQSPFWCEVSCTRATPNTQPHQVRHRHHRWRRQPTLIRSHTAGRMIGGGAARSTSFGGIVSPSSSSSVLAHGGHGRRSYPMCIVGSNGPGEGLTSPHPNTQQHLRSPTSSCRCQPRMRQWWPAAPS
jgi:hypothetical protein